MIKNKILGCILAGVFVLSGCTQKVTVNPESNIIQENLLVRCTKDTPIPVSDKVDSNGTQIYDGTVLIGTLSDWDKIYNICSTKDDALIDAIRKLQANQTIKVK
jgi:hypothetical protein